MAKRIRRGTFRSVRELERAIAAFVADHNSHAKPFVWTKNAGTILRKSRNVMRFTGHHTSRLQTRGATSVFFARPAHRVDALRLISSAGDLVAHVRLLYPRTADAKAPNDRPRDQRRRSLMVGELRATPRKY